MRATASLVAACAAVFLRAAAELPPPAVDVLVVGGTAKGVSAAVAARATGASTFLVTSQPYLGEDLAGTLELDAPPETPLEKRLWANATDHAAYDYWPARQSDGIRWIYKNDWWERISEPGIPPSPSDAVWYNDDISYRCVLRKPAKVARVEVIALSKAKEADSASAALVVKAGPRKGETIELTRRGAGFGIQGDYYSRRAQAISFSADVDAELSEVEVVVRKAPNAHHQLISRIWFHLADASTFDAPPSPLKVKRTFDRVLLDAGVGFLTCSPVRRVLRGADGRIAGVEIVNRSGRQTIHAKQVIDATRLEALEAIEKGALPVGPKETFSRRVMTAGVKPSAPGLVVEELPGAFPITHTQSSATGRFYRCTFEWPMKDGTFPSFAAAEWAARELTFTRRLMDDADLLVWHRGGTTPAALSARIREGERLGREATSNAAKMAALHAAAGGSRLSRPLGRDASPRRPPSLPIWGTYDVVVVGGGTSGAPAALAAARAGVKVLLIEYLNVLGGVGTDGMILGYFDGNHCGFTEEFKTANREFRDSFGLNVRASTWRKLCRDAGVEVWLGAMGTGATVENGKVTEVEVATEMGCGRVRATCFIDATGNSDIAAAAGARTEFLSAREFALQSAGQAPHRLGRGGINSDFGFVNDSDAADVWLFGVRARAGAPDAWDIAKLPDSRERRRIVPDYAVNAQDVTSMRPFPDVVVQAQSRQDSHGYLTDEFRFLSEPSAVVVPGKGEMRYQFIVNVPLRSLLPQGISGLAVIGLGAGCVRDVLPIVRMQADFMNMGYAVGTAAAMAARKGGDFRALDHRALRQALVEKGILRAETLGWNEETDVSSAELLAASVKSMAQGFKGSHVVCRPENRARALPLLRAAYAEAATPEAKQIYALTLGLFGDASGVETLLAVVKGTEPLCKVRRKGAFGGGFNSTAGFMLALGRTKDPRACEALLVYLKPIRPGSSLNAVRHVTLALEALGDPRAAPALAKCLRQKGLHGYAVSDPRSLPPQGGYGLGPEMDNCLRELALARALIACGDHEGLARRTFETYARDPRGVLSAHAKAVLDAYRPADITLENEAFRLVLAENGEAKSLVVKATGTECLMPGVRVPFVTIVQSRPYDNEYKLILPAKPWRIPSTGIVQRGDCLEVRFKDEFFVLKLRVRKAADYMLFTPEGVDYEIEAFGDKRPTEIDALEFLRLPVRERAHFGKCANVTWDGPAAVAVMAEDPSVEADARRPEGTVGWRVFQAGTLTKLGLWGKGAALMATPAKDFLTAVDSFERDCSLPRGVAMRRDPLAAASYWMMSSVNPANVDEHICLMKKGGFRIGVVSYSAFASTCGHFSWRKTYPNGLADLRAVADKMRAAGIVPGLHFHYNKVSTDDAYVSGGVPDPRLATVQHVVLARDASPTDTTLCVEGNLAALRRERGRRLVLFGQELVSFEDVSSNRLVGVQRGVYGSRPAAHPRHAYGRHLDVDDWPRFVRIDQDTDLQDEIAGRLAELVNGAGFRLFYFDGAEDTPQPFWHYVPFAQRRVWDKVKTPVIAAETAQKSHWGWHMFARGNAFDVFAPEYTRAAMQKYVLRCARDAADDFSTVNFGWIGVRAPGDRIRVADFLARSGKVQTTAGTQVDQIEYIACKALAWNAPLSVMGNLDVFKRHPHADELLAALKRWEDAKLAGAVPPDVRETMKDPKREWSLRPTKDGGVELVEITGR